MRRVAVLVGLLWPLILITGCGAKDSNTAASNRAFEVVVDEGAARVSREAGVDLKHLVEQSAGTVFRLLPHRDRIRIDVELNPQAVIPEIGVGGFTNPTTGAVFVAIAGNVRRDDLTTWIPATLAHELHHSSRIRTGPGYGWTLGEALVTEGLADHFVAEAFPSTPPQPWDNAFPSERESALWRQAERDLNSPESADDHRRWFFGAGQLPRWAGYTLGYKIVAAYLRADRKASKAVKTPADTVIAAYVRTRTEP
jgi:Predicted Zn-dependent protease (DUF2268)